MKKKIIASLSVFILFFSNIIFTNSSFALSFTRTGGSSANNVSTLITNGMYIDAGVGYLAGTVAPSDRGKVYIYNTTTEQTCTGNTEVSYSENKYYLYYEKLTAVPNEHLCYAIRIPGGNVTLNNVATLVFKQAVSYAGNRYDVKLNLAQISTTGSQTKYFNIPIANRSITNSNIWDMSTYNDGFWPQLQLRDLNSSNTFEAKVEYYLLDSDGNEFPVTGFFGFLDIDCNEGIYVDNFTASAENLYKRETLVDSVKYKSVNTGTYFYSSTSANTRSK